MSRWDDEPAIEYIPCALHTWLLQYVLLVAKAFLALSGKNDKHKSVTM